MSVVADGVLQADSAQNAPRLVAAEVFSLAHDGYITLNLTPEGVEVQRTKKATSSAVELERRLLLEAVSPQVTLNTPHQIPIAQTITALTCVLLRHRGLVRKLSPRRLMRSIGVGLGVLVTIAAIAATVISPEMACVGIALVVAVVLGWNTNSGVKVIKGRVGFYTKFGKRARKRLSELYKQVISGRAASDALLPYELLWTTDEALACLPKEAPHWFLGAWPATSDERSVLLRTMLTGIANSLNQQLGKKGRFELNEEIMKAADTYQFVGSVNDASKIFYGLSTDTPIDLGQDS